LNVAVGRGIAAVERGVVEVSKWTGSNQGVSGRNNVHIADGDMEGGRVGGAEQEGIRIAGIPGAAIVDNDLSAATDPRLNGRQAGTQRRGESATGAFVEQKDANGPEIE